MIYIIIGIVVILALIGIFTIYMHNKFKNFDIKINESEQDIAILLEERKDLFKKLSTIVNKKVKDTDFVKDVNDMMANELSNLDLYNKLKSIEILFNEVMDNNQKIEDNKDVKKHSEDLFNNLIELEGLIKFYNNYSELYNKLVKCFPANLVAMGYGYKNRVLYNIEKEESLKILKK